MALATSDEIRVVSLEVFKAAMLDFINKRADFDDRSYINQKIVELTPAE